MKVIVAILIFSFLSFGEESSDQVSKTNVNQSDNKKVGDEADQIITNRRFRAQQGSLSDWSLSTSWTYSGGSVDSPIGSSRPNITGASDVALIQSLTGNLGVSYRLNKKNRLTLGIGLLMASPFSSTADDDLSSDGRAEFESTQGELDFNNPILTYAHITKVFDVQTIISASSLAYTQDAFTDNGFQSRNRVTINTMYDFGKTGFSAGFLMAGAIYTHNDDNPALASGQTEYDFYVMPQAEYVINDTFNLRTIVRAWWYQNTRAQAFSDWQKLDLTQSVGLGISVARNVFLYPNIQFAPDNIRSDKTNVGLSANINLF